MRIWIVAAVAIVLLGASGDDDPKPFAADDFLVVPLRVHALSAEGVPAIDCKLAEADLKRIVAKVNRVWRSAGICWGLESILFEPAANLDRFRDADAPTSLTRYRELMPKDSRGEEGVDVYYIHKFSVNGVYLGDRVAFVQETALLREVEGGIDEHVPRVTAHELGHALGLAHRQARTNLLASGTTGTSLNTDEVAKARKVAGRMAGTRTTAALRKELDDGPEEAHAALVRGWLAEVTSSASGAASASPEGADRR